MFKHPLQNRLSGPSLRRASAILVFILVLACSPTDAPPWTDSEMKDLTEHFEGIGEAYALVDICMPLIETDKEAKYELVSAIKADRYAAILQLDTDAEFRKLTAWYRARGGTPTQNLILRLRYDEGRASAWNKISSIQVCVDTLKDYANTIINMRVT